MAEYLSPGVYIEEVNSGPRPIEGVGTAMAAFVGFAPVGPVGRPTLITNWAEYVEKFGTAIMAAAKSPHEGCVSFSFGLWLFLEWRRPLLRDAYFR